MALNCVTENINGQNRAAVGCRVSAGLSRRRRSWRNHISEACAVMQSCSEGELNYVRTAVGDQLIAESKEQLTQQLSA